MRRASLTRRECEQMKRSEHKAAGRKASKAIKLVKELKAHEDESLKETKGPGKEIERRLGEKDKRYK